MFSSLSYYTAANNSYRAQHIAQRHVLSPVSAWFLLISRTEPVLCIANESFVLSHFCEFLLLPHKYVLTRFQPNYSFVALILSHLSMLICLGPHHRICMEHLQLLVSVLDSHSYPLLTYKQPLIHQLQ